MEQIWTNKDQNKKYLNKIYVEKVFNYRFLKITDYDKKSGEKQMYLFDMQTFKIVDNFIFKSEWNILMALKTQNQFYIMDENQDNNTIDIFKVQPGNVIEEEKQNSDEDFTIDNLEMCVCLFHSIKLE